MRLARALVVGALSGVFVTLTIKGLLRIIDGSATLFMVLATGASIFGLVGIFVFQRKTNCSGFDERSSNFRKRK
jgi:hypothetical protein